LPPNDKDVFRTCNEGGSDGFRIFIGTISGLSVSLHQSEL